LGTILDVLFYVSLVIFIVYIWYGSELSKKNKERFNDLKGRMEFIGVGVTLVIALLAVKLSYESIQSSTESFTKVTAQFKNVITIFNRRPDIKMILILIKMIQLLKLPP
jgi:hypothetical protein